MCVAVCVLTSNLNSQLTKCKMSDLSLSCDIYSSKLVQSCFIKKKKNFWKLENDTCQFKENSFSNYFGANFKLKQKRDKQKIMMQCRMMMFLFANSGMNQTVHKYMVNTFGGVFMYGV